MNTVNISLTEQQALMTDKLVNLHGFANRSEFFRALLRAVFTNPTIIEKADRSLFASPHTYKASEIVAGFRKSKKYSKEFLEDLKTGLSESPSFNNK